MFSNSLSTYLILGVFLLIAGIYGLVQHRSFIGMLISTELILNGAGVNFMAFNRFLAPDPATGQIITLFIMGIAAAEAAIVVSFILAVFRKYASIDPGEVRELHG
jgi:NADH:ubiquinone oxidoreductase subunit K